MGNNCLHFYLLMLVYVQGNSNRVFQILSSIVKKVHFTEFQEKYVLSLGVSETYVNGPYEKCF